MRGQRRQGNRDGGMTEGVRHENTANNTWPRRHEQCKNDADRSLQVEERSTVNERITTTLDL